MMIYQPPKVRGLRGMGVHVETDTATGEQKVVMTDPGDAPVTTLNVIAPPSQWIPGIPNVATAIGGVAIGVMVLGGLFGGRR
jgi:hypothetical protein